MDEISWNQITKGKILNDSEKRILEYVIKYYDDVLSMGVREIAKNTFTSTSTIMCLAKKLGYTGFIDMHYKLVSFVKNEKPNLATTEDILSFFSSKEILQYNTYDDIKTTTNRIYNVTDNFIFIYATGFSSVIGEYLYKKLLVLGKKCLFATGSDSAGVFVNNILNIEMVIVVSRSGETPLVLEKVALAKENDVFVTSFTNETENRIGELSDINFKVHDYCKNDERNILPNPFFSNILMLFEIIVYEHHQMVVKESI